MHLQTLIGQVYLIVAIFSIVHGWSRTQITLLIYENSVVFGQEGPNSQVEFSVLVEERLFNVFLDDPEWFLLIFFINERDYIP